MASNQMPQHASASNAQENKQDNSSKKRREDCLITEETSEISAQNSEEKALNNSHESYDFRDDLLNRKCLTSCLPFLYEDMTVEEVVVRLQADNILTPYQANLICAEKTPFEKNQKLIDFVQKRGPKAFSCFMKSLTETGQQYIFEKLIEERKTIARREYLSTLSMWSTKIKTSATQKANLESLITKEELEQLKDIRVKKIPEEIGQIGKGAYGKVLLFKFDDGSIRAGKKPKIKLDNKSPEEESQLKRYLSYALGEIKILHQLDHERIISFYGFYLDQRKMIIFMEAMKGSVKDEINEQGCLSEMKAMNYFIQTAEGLVYLHSRRPTAVVHRDIKCENLLLTTEDNVKLADFGLAINLVIDNGSKTNLSTAPKSFVGTHLFHAPEILQTVNKPEAYGRKSDIWSLACTLVQMLSGEPPYRNVSLIELIQRSSTMSQNPLKYSGDILLPAASNEIKKLLDSMFTADYKLRPSAEEVLALAHDVVRAFQSDHNIGSKQLEDSERHSLHSLSNELQKITMNGQQTVTTMAETADVETVHNVRNLIHFSETTRKEGGHKKNLCGNSKAKEDSSSCRYEAEQGNVDAQLKLDNALNNGQIVNPSYEKIVKEHTTSAKQGNAEAQLGLGDASNTEQAVNPSHDNIAKDYTKSAEQENADELFMLSLKIIIDGGVSQSYEEAVKCYRKSAEQGNAYAQYNLGNMYKNGKGVPQSDVEAVKWYTKSAEQGDADAQSALGNMYDSGKGVPQSDGEAVKWYTKSAEQGNAAGQYNLGHMYRYGRGVPESYEEAIKWYTKSAEQGNADGQFNLGLMYASGRGVPQSDEEAVKWSSKSAEQGNGKAILMLGVMFMTGQDVPIINEGAVKSYRKSAEQGDADGQYNLGWMYETGRGVPESYKEAVKWYTKSAEQGNAKAQNKLSEAYYFGSGVTQSYEEALKWCKKSAEQGYAEAQNKLGDAYYRGIVVMQSDEEAIKWFRKSAKQGNADAQANLEAMTKKGQCIIS